MTKKISAAALKRLQDKGVKLNVIKKAEPPKQVNKPVTLKTDAVPAPIKQTAKISKKWKLENIERGWEGYITSLTITEV